MNKKISLEEATIKAIIDENSTFYHYSNNKYEINDIIRKSNTIDSKVLKIYNDMLNMNADKLIYMLRESNLDYETTYKYCYVVKPLTTFKEVYIDYSPIICEDIINLSLKNKTIKTDVEVMNCIKLFAKSYLGDNEAKESLDIILNYEISNKKEIICEEVKVIDKKENLTETVVKTSIKKVTEGKKEDMEIVSKALDSNNIPYIIKQNVIAMDYNNLSYNNARYTFKSKDSIKFNDDGTVDIKGAIYVNLLNKIPSDLKDLFNERGRVYINDLNLQENLPMIIKLFSVINKLQIEAEAEDYKEKDESVKIMYEYLRSSVKDILYVAFRDKYKFDRNQRAKIRELSKDVDFVKSIVDFVKSKI